MGLPKLQMLSGEIANNYHNDEVTSPQAFLSTLETIVRNENEPEEYEFLEEMDIGMVTEVTTSNEEVHIHIEDETVVIEECDAIRKDTETESCNQDDRLSLAGEDNACASSVMLEETVEIVASSENFDINCNFLDALSPGVVQDLNSSDLSAQEIISDVENSDFVLSWLSSLNESTTINDADLDISTSLNDEIPAKQELRSFILTRKKTSADLVDRQDPIGQQHNLRSRNDNVLVLPRRRKHNDCESSELQQLRRRQERNRKAAQRCRQKRTQLVDELSEESEKLRKENEDLTSEVRDLVKELRMLQNVLLDHDLRSISSQCHEQMSANIFSQELTKLTDSL